MRQIEQEQRRSQREYLRHVREELRDARVSRRLAIRDARDRCKSGRLAARARARELRARLLAEMRAAIKAERQDARSACAAATQAAKALGDRVKRARAELEVERTFRADMRRIERANRDRAKSLRAAAPRRRSERTSESDDAVRGNIPPELVALFERVKGKIRGSTRMSRTEAFLHYAEEHPREVLEVLEDKTEQLIAELEAREREGARALRRPVPRAAYDEVPF